MWTFGKRRCVVHGLIAFTLVCLPGCSDATLEPAPGTIDVVIQLNPDVPGSVALMQATYTGTWQTAPANYTGPAQTLGQATVTDSRSMNPSAQTNPITFQKDDIRAGTWQFSISVTGDGSGIFSTTCNGVRISPGSNTTTTITATQGGGCTSQ